MSMHDGGPAFPALDFIVPADLSKANVHRLGTVRGMSLRDYFAGQALSGLIAMGGIRAIVAELGLDVAGAQVVLAGGAYQLADAMLKARAQEHP